MGVLALRIGRGPANKSCSWQWVYKAKFYFWWFTSPLGPKGSPTPKGVFALPSSAVLKPAQAGLVKVLHSKLEHGVIILFRFYIIQAVLPSVAWDFLFDKHLT